MNTNITLPTISKGRPCVHVDGDNAVKEGQTVLCLEADSRNYTKALGKPASLSLADLTRNETQEYGPNEAEGANQGGEQRRCNLVNQGINNTEHLNKRKKDIWNGIGKKHGIRIATLNVKGRNKGTQKKWPSLSTLIRKLRIAIMGIQEIHLNDEEVEKLREKCPMIEIISNSEHTTKEGVGFILNKELIEGMKWDHEILIKNSIQADNTSRR